MSHIMKCEIQNKNHPERMSESCNSRHFSWLMKSCFPNQNYDNTIIKITTTTHISSLPDDLLLECLSRVPTSSLPSLPLVCRRWSRLLLSPSFFHLRRHLHPLHHSLFALSSSSLYFATLRFHHPTPSWTLQPLPSSLPINSLFFSHSRLSSIGPRIFMISPTSTLRFDTWTQTLLSCSPMLFPRKKFASAVISDKIYVAGGAARHPPTVDEYDPDKNTWRVVSHAPRLRYGCVGAAVDGVFYIIGGLKLGGGGPAVGREAHVYASSMDLYDVEGGAWLRSRALPGGGCVVGACAAMGHVYVLANHAVELSFWRFDARRRNNGGGGFGEWSRIKSPPLAAGQLRVDSRVKFSCVGVEDKVVLVQVMGCIDDLLRRSGGGRSSRGCFKQSLVLVYNISSADWTRGPDLPDLIPRAACVDFHC